MGHKIVYLFGAGATQADFINLYPSKSVDENFSEKNSLLMSYLSKRVCKAVKDDKKFSKKIEKLLSPAGLANIELFISLIEKNEVRSENVVHHLKKFIKEDILRILTESRLRRFYLHKALLELHSKIDSEELLGLITLNYDEVLDMAYETIFKTKPNYSLSSKSQDDIPLLKLHGGFKFRYRKKKLPIITPAIDKNYLELPYNFIWGRALEAIIDCDILRIVGSSISENDIALVDLLFKAHLARSNSFEIQMINFDPDNNPVKQKFGFLPNIKTATELEGGMISDVNIKKSDSGANPFKIWLKAKVEQLMIEGKLSQEDIRSGSYLKKVLK